MTKNFFLRFFSSIFLAPLIIFLIYSGKYYFFLLLLMISIISIYETFQLKKTTIKLVICLLLFSFTFSAIEIINKINGNYIILNIFFLTCLSDIGGYFFGKIFGGKKIKIISPNKTYFGFLGSILFALLGCYAANILGWQLGNDIFLNYFFVFICTLVVIFGDLLFSYFKRKCLIKDFSNFIPGHGGLLDRIDGLIVLTVFVYFIIK